MVKYYRNRPRVVIKILGAGFVAIILGVYAIKSSEPASIFFGLVLLGLLFILFYTGLMHPALAIDGNKITIRASFGKKWNIENLLDYKLVLSTDFLAFRKKGQNDIMVDKDLFSNDEWKIMTDYLKSLSFEEVLD